MISMQHVTKRYGPISAVQDVSFTVKKGAITGLLGRNGAGKTTLLNLMTGYFPPDEGCVIVDGLNMMQSPAECKRKIGYLPEKPPLYDEMTVMDYLKFVCDLKEVSVRERKRHIDEILQLSALEKMRQRLIGQLSKGYRQRVGIAQALCGNPKILILDEPTVGLDPRQVVEMRELIRILGEEHTVLFSSHILPEVQHLCTEVVILHEGRLIRCFNLLSEESAGEVKLKISVLGKASELLPAIRSIGCIESAEEIASEVPGVTVVRIAGKEQDERGVLTDQIFHLMAAMDMPIREMITEKNELEQIFLESTSD